MRHLYNYDGSYLLQFINCACLAVNKVLKLAVTKQQKLV